ncbi:MAG: RagB/SusD family nutrient uptake outer membrane protein [Phocaeicola sp.]|uniref:RagB/SusD family nutrient uptake outer membrane protein n=1 Tax=Phocaeicola TaxID=909656 RepID=UPI00234F15AD|nr:RagB/SusD family nutrient uptake outer membrane protein [Phocaeicola oris]MCE2616880.1 RagB/SusD family nutrient uptake outer membrane protein [Phocaeicola oris]
MKKIYLIIFALTGLLMTSCNDSFLDQKPETSITETSFFKTDADLELYSNGFYPYYYVGTNTSAAIADSPSDNVVVGNTTDGLYRFMSGAVNANNIGKWDWSSIRVVNFMIARMGNASGAKANHYKGFARLTRAMFYYDKVRTYSDVPWYSRDLQTNDDDLLYKTQDSRAMVVDSIVADLNYAIENMKPAGELGDHVHISKDAAIALKARICLEEASWRKYHAELGLSDANTYYQFAIDACEQLMTMGYSLSSDYGGFFRNTSLAGNPEAILYRDYDRGMGIMWWYSGGFSGGNYGASKDLFDSYLYLKDNGTAMPYTSVDGYNVKSYVEGFKNRDPRLGATFIYPGFIRPGNEIPYVQYINQVEGYNLQKYEPMKNGENVSGYGSGNTCFGDISLFRYAEILLIYAEAKAEMGTLEQSDLDKTINLLRVRAGMPTAQLSDWLSNIDPVLKAKYSNVSSSQEGAVLEVRRERRVELAFEGFRRADLFRWAMGKTFEDQGKGIYVGTTFPAEIDLTGDGKADVAIVSSQAEKEAEVAKGLAVYIIDVDGINVSTDGFIEPTDKKGIYTFDTKCYYTPISSQDMVVNPNLKQNPNWN